MEPDSASIARWINPKIRGWMTYYGAFCRSELYPSPAPPDQLLPDAVAHEEVHDVPDLEDSHPGLALIIHAGRSLPRSVSRIVATAEILASGYDCGPAGGPGAGVSTGPQGFQARVAGTGSCWSAGVW